MKRFLFPLLICLSTFFIILHAYPETILFKSGKPLRKIIKKNNDSIKVDVSDVALTYFFDDIESIDGVMLNRTEQSASGHQPRTAFSDESLLGNTKAEILSLLNDLGYPLESLPALEQELSAFLIRLNLPSLKQQAQQAKDSPVELKRLLETIRILFKQQGYLEYQYRQPLTRLLISSFGKGDLLAILDASSIDPKEKEQAKK
ncbi:hypothetical protein LDC_0328, partial [sediment metagenome]